MARLPYAFGYAVASDGASGLSLFVTSSTTSIAVDPRVDYQTVLVPLVTSTSGVDAGEDAGGAVDASTDGGTAMGTGASSSSAGCGCTTAPSGDGPGSIVFALLAASVLAGRARKRAQRG